MTLTIQSKTEMKILITLTIIVLSSLVARSTVTSFTADISYNGYAEGEYEIFRSEFTTSTIANLRNPIVFVEGIDANNEYQLGDLWRTIYNDATSTGISLGQQLNNQGYDIVILNFADGGDYIQKNAFLLVKLINLINAGKPNDSPLVVMGYSMGGVVARYALAYMESQAIDHETRLYVSFDAPHKGAGIPLSVQQLALTFSDGPMLAAFPALQQSLNQFQCPAAKQLLRYRISRFQSSGQIGLDTGYVSFFNELNSLNSCHGFPTKCRNVAISLGSWTGVPQKTNLDVDGDSQPDNQFAGIPTTFINFPSDTNDNKEIRFIWQLNNCEQVASFSFQIRLASSASWQYPYMSDRVTYTGLADTAQMFTNFWYYSPGLNPLFPSSFSRYWIQGGGEPLDFEPGSYTQALGQVVEGINSQVQCSYAVSSVSTFIPTISALCYDTDDPFLDIKNDPNQSSRTPFDAIIGIDGDNRSHENSQTVYSTINSFIINEVTNRHQKQCAYVSKYLTGTAPTGFQTISDATDVSTGNYTVGAGTAMRITAPGRIELNPSTLINTNYFVAETGPCTVFHPCGYANQHAMYRRHPMYASNTNFKYIEDGSGDFANQPVSLAPNPTNGSFSLYSFSEPGTFTILNLQGQQVAKGAFGQGKTEYHFDLIPSLYFVYVNCNGNLQTIKLVINK